MIFSYKLSSTSKIQTENVYRVASFILCFGGRKKSVATDMFVSQY